MTERAGTLAIVSAERVRDEFTKLLLSPTPAAGLTLLVRHRPGRRRSSPSCRPCASSSTSTTGTRTSTTTP